MHANITFKKHHSILNMGNNLKNKTQSYSTYPHAQEFTLKQLS